MLQLMLHMHITDVAAIYPDHPVICNGRSYG